MESDFTTGFREANILRLSEAGLALAQPDHESLKLPKKPSYTIRQQVKFFENQLKPTQKGPITTLFKRMMNP
jgi:hypothetical protein